MNLVHFSSFLKKLGGRRDSFILIEGRYFSVFFHEVIYLLEQLTKTVNHRDCFEFLPLLVFFFTRLEFSRDYSDSSPITYISSCYS